MAEPKKEEKPKKSLSDAAMELMMGSKVSAEATESEMMNKLNSIKETGSPEQIAAIEKEIEAAKKKKEAVKGEGQKALEK
jgi:hypothetical protein